MIVAGQDDKLKLEAEFGQHRVERQAIESYAKELDQRLNQMRAQLAATYKSNIEISRKLERAQMRLKAQIDQRTAGL